MNVKIFRKLFELCEDFQLTKCLTPAEFIVDKDLDDDIVNHFLNLQKHDRILRQIARDFICYHAIISKIDETRLKVLFYITIFTVNEANLAGIKKIFVIVSKITHMSNILSYFLKEENRIKLAKLACSYFENDYVLSNIVNPIERNLEYYEEILEFVNRYERNHNRKEVTVPYESKIYEKSKFYRTTHNNTATISEETLTFRCSKVPKTTYVENTTIQEKLFEEHKKNKERAEILLKNSKSLTNHREYKKGIVPEEPWYSPPRPIKVPKKRNVTIKGNLVTVMREAALYAKEKEQCIKEIDDILKGGVDTKLLKEIEKEMREIEQQKQLEDIERKRLMCLLSHEEAAIAKCRLIETNKERTKKMLEEREQLRKYLEEWKEQEKQNYKLKVQQVHDLKKDMKEIERKNIEEKQSNARVFQLELKEMLAKVEEERERELARKIQIIQEIKAVHQIRSIDRVKDFDKHETSNLGLLCEMSIAELEERLQLTRQEMEKELDLKRHKISKEKETKQKMIEEAKKFVEQNRVVKVKATTTNQVKLVENETIREMRRKIEEAKAIRQGFSCK